MQQERLDEQMLGVGRVPVGDKVDKEQQRLPAAPVGGAKARQQREEELDEEEELKKLQAEMAM